MAAIEVFVERLQAAQQAEDVPGFMELFTEHAVWTTAHGKRIVGRGKSTSTCSRKGLRQAGR